MTTMHHVRMQPFHHSNIIMTMHRCSWRNMLIIVFAHQLDSCLSYYWPGTLLSDMLFDVAGPQTGTSCLFPCFLHITRCVLQNKWKYNCSVLSDGLLWGAGYNFYTLIHLQSAFNLFTCLEIFQQAAVRTQTYQLLSHISCWWSHLPAAFSCDEQRQP